MKLFFFFWGLVTPYARFGRHASRTNGPMKNEPENINGVRGHRRIKLYHNRYRPIILANFRHNMYSYTQGDCIITIRWLSTKIPS